ncbi:sigma-70 family RNA polymerase sigma factor [Aeoliella mucimassa]|uniref:sigma-70 family RNA polymerase sigma factor n=1 Tax=Aeoliella mucimassa TaxID=2527972 RepID=UPI0018D3DF45|nr:sigma-70 family RNA polymerase sigma factor [Aeoliella mucimassa]
MSVPISPSAVVPDLAQLIEDHQATVWRYVRYLGADSTEADDLVQETFLAVHRSDFVYESARQAASYLRTTARNRLLILRRQQRREPSQVELEAADAVWAEMVGDGPVDPYLEALDHCLETLEGRARRALDLHYTDRRSRVEIATELEMKPEGVKSLLRRIRELLRDCIERKIKS